MLTQKFNSTTPSAKSEKNPDVHQVMNKFKIYDGIFSAKKLQRGIDNAITWVNREDIMETNESLFPPVLWGSSGIKSHCLSNQIPGGFQVPLSDPQAGKPLVGLRTFPAVRELLWYHCSPICGSPPWWVWDLILT